VSLTWESGGIGEPLDEQEPMLNYSKRNPTIFFGGVGEVYIVGWVLTGYLFDCPQNSRLFLPLRPERPGEPAPVGSGADGRFEVFFSFPRMLERKPTGVALASG
jgi:hypothetical protein